MKVIFEIIVKIKLYKFILLILFLLKFFLKQKSLKLIFIIYINIKYQNKTYTILYISFTIYYNHKIFF